MAGSSQANIVGEAPGSSATAPPFELIVRVGLIGPPAGVTEAGLKLQAAPTGKPPQLNVTGCVKPALGVMVIDECFCTGRNGTSRFRRTSMTSLSRDWRYRGFSEASLIDRSPATQ